MPDNLPPIDGAAFDALVDTVITGGYEARIPYIVTGREQRIPENALQTPNAQQLFNAFRVALRDELARLHADRADIYVTDPFNPPPSPFYDRLVNAVTTAHQKERFRR